MFTSNKGANCPATCPDKKLEAEHKKTAKKMIAGCFPKKKMKVIFPANAPLLSNNWKWGWTDDIKQVIYLPWYTLRSKKEFFETNPHEAGHNIQMLDNWNRTFSFLLKIRRCFESSFE